MRNSPPLDRVGLYLRELGYPWAEEERARWETYARVFEEWALKVNLVSSRDRPHWIERHVFPSLALLKAVRIEAGQVVLDVGTGAGFPGLPLAMVRRDCLFYLVEPKRWRSLFLEEAVEQLGLENVLLLPERVESSTVHERLSGRCDWIIARAVARLSTLWQWVAPLLAPAGALLAYKGPDQIETEIQELERRIQLPVRIDVRALPLTTGTTLVIVKPERIVQVCKNNSRR